MESLDLQLQKSIAALVREIGPRLHCVESTGLREESKVLPEEAVGMLEAARTARRLMDPGWCGEEGQVGCQRQAKELLEWAAKPKELAMSRRDIELEFGDIQGWR